MFDGNILHPSLKENEYMYSKCLPRVIVFCLKTYIKKLNIISTMNKYMQCIVLKSAGFIIIPIYNWCNHMIDYNPHLLSQHTIIQNNLSVHLEISG